VKPWQISRKLNGALWPRWLKKSTLPRVAREAVAVAIMAAMATVAVIILAARIIVVAIRAAIGAIKPGKVMSTPTNALTLFLNSDDTLSGRFLGFPLIEFRAEFNAERQSIDITPYARGFDAKLTDALSFPFEPGAQQLVCSTDAGIILERQNSEKAPWRMTVRQMGADTSNPW